MRTTAVITIENPPRIYARDFIQFTSIALLEEAVASWEKEIMLEHPNTDYELTVEEYD
jgi:hypothetical protein